MNLRSLCLCFAFSIAIAGTDATAQQLRTAPEAPGEKIENLGPMLQRVNAFRSELRQYHACTCTCGCYAKDLDFEADQAIAFLKNRAARRKADEKLAMVLDIDETTLSNWKEMDGANFEYNEKAFDAWVESAEAPAIEATLRLYNEAKRLDVSVYFLTGRPESQRAATETNLKLAGFSDWHKLIMRGPGENGTTALAYKSAERAKIVAEGFRIVLNVGDQWSDLRGTSTAEYSVKYPDPYYFIK